MTSPKTNADANAAERQRMRLEQLLTVSRRLSEALAADIEALEQGAFGALKTSDPEIERLCAFYGREVRALRTDGIKRAPAQLVTALRESGARLDELLKHHGHLVAAMREAAEGLVQAVADGVEKARSGAKPYTREPKPSRTSSGAIVCNKVV